MDRLCFSELYDRWAKKCENQPNLTPETARTHWSHTLTISWHIITWFTNTDFRIEEWREFAVFRPFQWTVVISDSLPGFWQLASGSLPNCWQLSLVPLKGLNTCSNGRMMSWQSSVQVSATQMISLALAFWCALFPFCVPGPTTQTRSWKSTRKTEKMVCKRIKTYHPS